MEALNPGGDTSEQSQEAAPTVKRKHVSAEIDKRGIDDYLNSGPVRNSVWGSIK